MRKLIIAAVLAFLPMSAIADETPKRFDGLYMGLNAGAFWNDQDLTYNNNDTDDDAIGTVTLDVDGISVGLHAGYRHQFTNGMVLGLEAGLERLDLGDNITNDTDSTDTESISIDGDYMASLVAMVGYVPQAEVLVYAKGGFGIAAYDFSVTEDDGEVTDGTNTEYVETSNIEYRYIIGAGVEWAFHKNWSVRAEYLHSNSINEYDIAEDEFNESNAGDNHSIGSIDQIKVGFTYQW